MRALRRFPWAAFGAAGAALVAGCNVCGPDQRSVVTYAEQGFTVSREAGPTEITTLNGTIWDRQLGSAFPSLWDVFARGKQPYPGVAVTATGGSAGQMVGLVLALPTPVRSGQHVTVDGAFAPPAEPYVMYWSVWGSHPSRTGQAEIAVRVSDFSTTGGVTNAFVATSATGTIDVAAIEDQAFRLQLDIVARNDTGESAHLQGPLVIRLQRQSATCFS